MAVDGSRGERSTSSARTTAAIMSGENNSSGVPVNSAFGVRTRAQKKRDDLIREADRNQAVPGLQVVKEEVGESDEGVSDGDSKLLLKH